jgi:hypothetical protein
MVKFLVTWTILLVFLLSAARGCGDGCSCILPTVVRLGLRSGRGLSRGSRILLVGRVNLKQVVMDIPMKD